jgi:hypothetical protein
MMKIMFITTKMSVENLQNENMAASWNDYHESILKSWGEQSACYRYMHHRAFLMFKKLSLRFNLPVIVLSTITGTANFAQSTLPASIQPAAPSIIGGLNLVAGLIATIMQFLKIQELMENHRTSALGHGNLSRNIRLQLALPREERKKEGLKFVEECKTTYDSLLEQSPPIPKHILLNFEKEYPRESNFTKPEILRVRAIPLLKSITRNTPLERVFRNGEEDEEEVEVEIEVDEEEEMVTDEEEDVEQGRPAEPR